MNQKVSTAFFRPLGIFLLTVQLAIISAAPLNDLEGPGKDVLESRSFKMSYSYNIEYGTTPVAKKYYAEEIVKGDLSLSRSPARLRHELWVNLWSKYNLNGGIQPFIEHMNLWEAEDVDDQPDRFLNIIYRKENKLETIRSLGFSLGSRKPFKETFHETVLSGYLEDITDPFFHITNNKKNIGGRECHFWAHDEYPVVAWIDYKSKTSPICELTIRKNLVTYTYYGFHFVSAEISDQVFQLTELDELPEYRYNTV